MEVIFLDCVFCEIVNGNIGCEKIYEDERVLAFKDLKPQAPVHFLIIPKKHIKDVLEISKEDKDILYSIFLSIQKIAKDLGLEDGFRVVNNCGEDGGQTVLHLHFHVLGKRKLSWPPG